MSRCKSVLDLAKHRKDDELWWVVLRPKAEPKAIDESEIWMRDCHPKVYFDRGYGERAWPSHQKLPMLGGQDFTTIMSLLTHQLVIESFKIKEVARSGHTGEFLYLNQLDEWAPEDMLCKNRANSVKERDRILGMINKWHAAQTT
jgi:hypothetical protein